MGLSTQRQRREQEKIKSQEVKKKSTKNKK